jgi:hypothetical protein
LSGPRGWGDNDRVVKEVWREKTNLEYTKAPLTIIDKWKKREV